MSETLADFQIGRRHCLMDSSALQSLMQRMCRKWRRTRWKKHQVRGLMGLQMTLCFRSIAHHSTSRRVLEHGRLIWVCFGTTEQLKYQRDSKRISICIQMGKVQKVQQSKLYLLLLNQFLARVTLSKSCSLTCSLSEGQGWPGVISHWESRRKWSKDQRWCQVRRGMQCEQWA